MRVWRGSGGVEEPSVSIVVDGLVIGLGGEDKGRTTHGRGEATSSSADSLVPSLIPRACRRPARTLVSLTPVRVAHGSDHGGRDGHAPPSGLLAVGARERAVRAAREGTRAPPCASIRLGRSEVAVSPRPCSVRSPCCLRLLSNMARQRGSISLVEHVPTTATRETHPPTSERNRLRVAAKEFGKPDPFEVVHVVFEEVRAGDGVGDTPLRLALVDVVA